MAGEASTGNSGKKAAGDRVGPCRPDTECGSPLKAMGTLRRTCPEDAGAVEPGLRVAGGELTAGRSDQSPEAAQQLRFFLVNGRSGWPEGSSLKDEKRSKRGHVLRTESTW